MYSIIENLLVLPAFWIRKHDQKNSHETAQEWNYLVTSCFVFWSKSERVKYNYKIIYLFNSLARVRPQEKCQVTKVKTKIKDLWNKSSSQNFSYTFGEFGSWPHMRKFTSVAHGRIVFWKTFFYVNLLKLFQSITNLECIYFAFAGFTANWDDEMRTRPNDSRSSLLANFAV